MNKSDLIKAISEQSGFTNKDTQTFLDAFIDVTTSTLSKGEEIALTGFGAFSVTKRAARTGKNFQTGKAIEIPESKGVKFKPGKTLKDSIN